VKAAPGKQIVVRTRIRYGKGHDQVAIITRVYDEPIGDSPVSSDTEDGPVFINATVLPDENLPFCVKGIELHDSDPGNGPLVRLPVAFWPPADQPSP
jgi:hypothetical protein